MRQCSHGACLVISDFMVSISEPRKPPETLICLLPITGRKHGKGCTFLAAFKSMCVGYMIAYRHF